MAVVKLPLLLESVAMQTTWMTKRLAAAANTEGEEVVACTATAYDYDSAEQWEDGEWLMTQVVAKAAAATVTAADSVDGGAAEVVEAAATDTTV